MIRYKEEVKDEVDKIEKSLKKWASDNWAPVISEEPFSSFHEGGFVVGSVVPLDGMSSSDKVDYITSRITCFFDEESSPNKLDNHQHHQEVAAKAYNCHERLLWFPDQVAYWPNRKDFSHVDVEEEEVDEDETKD